MPGRNRDAELENRCVALGCQGRGGMDWETGIDVCAPARVRQELSSVLCVTKTGGMWAGWEEGKKTGYIYIYIYTHTYI